MTALAIFRDGLWPYRNRSENMRALQDAQLLTPVECSCGAKTMLRFNGTKYEPMDDGWQFRTVAEAELYERSSGKYINCGWYCGQPDHEQKISGRVSQG